jgi:hypothetical protein
MVLSGPGSARSIVAVVVVIAVVAVAPAESIRGGCFVGVGLALAVRRRADVAL